jgi:WhiB family transcriptional regulator, redox-sensing transcriptional regulator
MKPHHVPATVNDDWQWQLAGSCRSVDPKLFFPPENEQGGARRERTSAAKAICASCPVIQQCRQHGLAVREPCGVWGGLGEDDREAIYRAQRSHATAVAPDETPPSRPASCQG